MVTAGKESVETLPDIVEPADVAAFLHISTKTVYALIRSGRLRACRLGRRYRIRKSWLLDFLDEG